LFAVRLDQANQLLRKLGEVGQSLMDDYRLARGRIRGGTPDRALGGHALALDQQNRAVRSATVERGAGGKQEHYDIIRDNI
jgi:hypothetical protein